MGRASVRSNATWYGALELGYIRSKFYSKIKTKNKMTKINQPTFSVAEMEPRLRPLAKVSIKALKHALKYGITAEFVNEFENIQRWKRGDEKILNKMLQAKIEGQLVYENSSLIPKRNQSSKKPSRAKIAKVPLKKRVITPPMTQPPQTDENSPPETMKPRVKTPPTETSTLEPATPSSEFPMGNQTMSAEKIFRPISETDSELEDL